MKLVCIKFNIKGIPTEIIMIKVTVDFKFIFYLQLAAKTKR